MKIRNCENIHDRNMLIPSHKIEVCMKKSIWTFLMTAGLLSVASAQTPVFIDTFENGVPANSDNIPGFWTANLPETSTVSEENGKLVQTASSDSAGTIHTTLAGLLSTNCNFFTRQLKFSADLTVDGDTASTFMNYGQFMVASESSSGYDSPDTLMVGFQQSDRITFSCKLNAPNVFADQIHPNVTKLLETTLQAANQHLDRFELTLNANRYRLKAFTGGTSVLRISGEHGISQANWGSSGDSALLLETMRSSAADAGTTSTGIWDNVEVETDASRLLAEPYYEFQATYFNSSGVSATNDYTLWLPSTEPVIRGVIFFGPGSGSDFRYMVHDFAAQEAARNIGFALIGYQNAGNMNLWSDDPAKIQPAVQAVLDAAAGVSGHPEISNAPLCITGNSAGAFDSCFLAMNWPERVIAFVNHRGYASDSALPAAAKKVPGLMVAGSADGNSATEPFTLQNNFLIWRSQGAQVAYAVDWRVGHTPYGNQGWEGTFTWFVEVANLRYPRPLVPSLESGAGWPELIDLADASGWLADRTQYSAPYTPSVTSLYTTIAPYADYGGAVSNASWLPNETCARMYRALTSTDRAVRTVVPLQTPLRITSPAQFADVVVVGQPVSIDLDPREFDDVNAIASVDFYDGETLLGTDTNGPEWSWAFTPTNTGLHTLSLVATDTLGTQGAAFRTLPVVPDDFPPVAFSQIHTFSGANNLSDTVTGVDPEGDPITFALAVAPAHGQLLDFDISTGAFTYQPDSGYVGTDNFTFAVASSGITGNMAEVSLDVMPADTAGRTPLLDVNRQPGILGEYFVGQGGATSAASTFTGTPDVTRLHTTLLIGVHDGSNADYTHLTNNVTRLADIDQNPVGSVSDPSLVDQLAARYTGRFDVSTSGEYNFSFSEQNDWAQLFVDGVPVLENTGSIITNYYPSRFLGEGEHTLELLAGNINSGTDDGVFDISLYVTGPDGVTEPVDQAMVYQYSAGYSQTQDMFIDDFESYTAGESVDGSNGWTDVNASVDQGATVAATNSTLGSGSQALHFTDTDSAASTSARVRNIFDSNTNNVQVEFDFMTPNGSQAPIFSLWKGASGSDQLIKLQLSLNETSVRYQDSAGIWHTLDAGMSYGKWYTFRITTDFDTDTFDLTITDGVTPVTFTGLAFYKSGSSVDRLDFTTNTGGSGTGADFYVDELSIAEKLPTPSRYDLWATAHNVIGGKTADDDGDGLNNLIEYGLGGDPTNSLDRGYLPTGSVLRDQGTNWFDYVYFRRYVQDSGLTYSVELNHDLLSTNWVNAGYFELPAVQTSDQDFEAVTNRIQMTNDTQFIRLRIQANQ